MSRIGKEPVAVPDGVDVTVADGAVRVTGPLGTLTQPVPVGVTVAVEERTVRVTRADDAPERRALHGLMRTLVANMVTGVAQGYRKELELVGVGYRAAARSSTGITLQVGYSHPVQFDAPEGVTLEVSTPTRLSVSGPDKQVVGQVAANIRKVRPPEPYKGKGIRYRGEQVRRKAGKAAG